MSSQPSPVGVTHQPYYVRQHQSFAIDNERQRRIQALYSFGEPALFTLMWKVEDFEAGLVTRCTRCRQNPASIEGRIEAAYQQPLTATCPVCYGTTYQGGIRAQIIRPAIFNDVDEDERKSPRGVIHPESTVVESTGDFRSRTGDYVFRRDNSRWQLGVPSRVQVRTGYEHPGQAATSIGYARIQASREDAASVAYAIPPSGDLLATYLDVVGVFPASAAAYSLINTALIPSSEVE